MQNPNPVIKNYIISSEVFVPKYNECEKQYKHSEISILSKSFTFEISLYRELLVQNKV